MHTAARIALERASSAKEASRILYLASFNAKPVPLVAFIERRAAHMIRDLRAHVAQYQADVYDLQERVARLEERVEELTLMVAR